MDDKRLDELRQLAGAVDRPKSQWMDELIDEVESLRAQLEQVTKERDGWRGRYTSDVATLEGYIKMRLDPSKPIPFLAELQESLGKAMLDRDKAQHQLQQAQAEAGAMRKVLERMVPANKNCDCGVCAPILSALSSSTGKAFSERMEKLERVAEEARRVAENRDHLLLGQALAELEKKS